MFGMASKLLGLLAPCLHVGPKDPPEIVVGPLQAPISYPGSPGGPNLTDMPDDEAEIDAKFSELVDELDLTEAHRAAIFQLAPEKKWQMYLTKRQELDDPNTKNQPDYYIDKVNGLSVLVYSSDEEEMRCRVRLIDSLKTALRTQPMSFVVSFMKLSGLNCLLDFLSEMDSDTLESSLHTSVIQCIKALMNNSLGRCHVLEHVIALNTIAQSLGCENVKTKISVLEILGAICLVPDGHKKVLEACEHYRLYAGERTRFQSLVSDLERWTGSHRYEVGLKTAIMSFINAVINYGSGEDQLEFRLHLRGEFLALGIQNIIDRLRSHENATLDRHLDFFEMSRGEDEKEHAKMYDKLDIDCGDPDQMYDCIKRKVPVSEAFPHFLSVLQHMLLLPVTSKTCTQYWRLFDRTVQQIVLQHDDGFDPDIQILDMNIREAIQLLSSQDQIIIAKQRAEQLEKNNVELLERLSRKEREVEVKCQEKEDLEASLDKVKQKLEQETMSHIETRQRLTYHHHHQQHDNDNTNESNIDSDRVGYNMSPSSPPSPPHSPTLTSSSHPCPPPPPPPPPPGAPGAPPLPPPSLMQTIKKNVPKSSHPLKSFNWSKLSENKLMGTLWRDLEDEKLYRSLDLPDFERYFSAYQKGCGGIDGDEEMTMMRSVVREVSVVDGRRAQNLNILLSRLKLSNEQVAHAVWSMDEKEDIPRDMCEQLLKFIPSLEESALLEEHKHEIDAMARADRYLYEMSRIPHYEQRLRGLVYKKKFAERLAECRPKIEACLDASKEVYRSKKLKKLLEIVLALGNYMNRGQRGNAVGFEISSLNRMVDTKSSVDRHVTLLHYLVDLVDKKFPDVAKMMRELPHVSEAAKVNMTELQKEVTILKVGLREIDKELQFHHSHPSHHRSDKFISVMTEFLKMATCKFAELEDVMSDMKCWFERCAKLFGEDANKAQTEEFFTIFDQFLQSFAEAKADNDQAKKRREEEQRRRQEEERKRKVKEKRMNKHNSTNNKIIGNGNSRMLNGKSCGINSVGNDNLDQGEFDDLISALRTGDVFTGMNLKKQRKRSSNTKTVSNGFHCRERVNGTAVVGAS